MSQVLTNTIMDKIIPAFGWMLIHSLWEGLLFAIITGIVLMAAKKAKAAYRYNMVLGLFTVFIGTCIFTFILELGKSPASALLKPVLPGGGATIVPALFSGNLHNVRQLMKTFTDYFSANEPLIVLIWFIVFLFKSFKMLSCLIYNQQVRSRQVFEPSAFWAEKVTLFSKKLQIDKAVKLLQSGYVKMPVVVGHLKPLILIPAGLLAGLPAEQIEAILLHELAHIRRNDYFVNFLQNIAETIFFFNPGLLWISSLLREERENCCDDIALEQTQNKVGFVQALISFKEHELYGSAYAVAFPGKKNYLLRRVRRIMSNTNMTFGIGEKIFFIGSILILSVFVTAASVVRLKEFAKTSSRQTKITLAVVPLPAIGQKATAINNIAYARVVKTKIRIARINAGIKMRDGIPGIQPGNGAVEGLNTIVTPLSTIDQAESKKELSAKDQVEKVNVQGRSDQEQARIDQLQAMRDQEQALKDQLQAKIDQAAALKDQAQAKIDQEQAQKDRQAQKSKDQIKADRNKDQLRHNEEQARLNELQVKRNQQQSERNQEQARLNEIQNKKNQEQAVRNEEQARLNQIQEKKNEEQAVKNKVSVQ